MKRPTLFLLAAALFAAMTAPAAAISYVAVVETEVDEQSGAAAMLNKAEVRLMTTELRSAAVKNLPRDKYNIITSETVMAQGSAKLEECAEENCVIALGAKIGADFIVRGIVSKLGTNLTMSVEMYETEDGNLVATSGVVRAGNIADLVDKAAAVCVDMYKTFASSQESVRKAPAAPAVPAKPATYTVTAVVNPSNGGYVTRSPDKTAYDPGETLTLTAAAYGGYEFTGWTGASTSSKAILTAPVDRNLTLMANFRQLPKPETSEPKPQPAAQPPTPDVPKTSAAQTAESGGGHGAKKERKPMTGFSLGSTFAYNGDDDSHWALWAGIAHSRPITKERLSFNAEGDIQIGKAYNADESFGFFGVSLPMTALWQYDFLSIEAGAHADMVFGAGETLFNAGIVAGAGVRLSNDPSLRYFYRYSGGYNFGAHVIGMRWMF